MASSTATSFEAQVIGPLRRVARKLKLRLLLEGLGLTVLIFMAVAAVQLLLDLLLVLGLGPRIALQAIVCGILAYQLWHRLIRPAAIRISPDDIAAILERHDPSLRADALVSAVAFSRASRPGFDSQAMVDALIADVQSRFKTIRPESLLAARRKVQMPVLSVALLVILIFSVTGRSGLLWAYFSRDWLLNDTPWPSHTHIVVEGLSGNRMTWPLGDDFTLVAIAQGERPPSLRAEVKLDRAVSSGSAAIREMPRRGEDQFILEYGPLTGSMKVRFLIGRFGVDEPTQWYDVEAVERPHLESAVVTVSPPAYTDLPKLTLPPGQTSVEALRGSGISIVATLNKPVTSASLRGSGDQRLPAAIASVEKKQIHTDFTPTLSGSYYFELVNAGGLTDLHPLPITVRLINDPPPKVKLSLPGTGEIIVAGAVLDLDIDCEDNIALRTVDLRNQLSHESPGATSQPDSFTEVVPGFEPRSPRFATRHSWPLSGLGLKSGDQLTLLVRATDYQPVAATPEGKSPGISDSIAYTLRVVTPEELLAELGRRESEWRREFELIVKSQADLKKRVLDLHDQATKGFTAEISAQYAREEAAQRAQVSRIKTIRRQFEQILAELKTDQLDQPGMRKQLDGGVIQPLGRLATRKYNQVADKMAELRRQYEKKSAQAVEQAQTSLLEDMNAILAAMLKWEGYNEAVSLLRNVIRLQTELNRQTQGRVEEQAEGIFGEPSSRPSEKK